MCSYLAGEAYYNFMFQDFSSNTSEMIPQQSALENVVMRRSRRKKEGRLLTYGKTSLT